MNERRSSLRHRVLKAATIEFNRAGGVSCMVRNLSTTGACIEVESPLGSPESFDLAIKNEPPIRHCKIAWRTAHRLGVSFI